MDRRIRSSWYISNGSTNSLQNFDYGIKTRVSFALLLTNKLRLENKIKHLALMYIAKNRRRTQLNEVITVSLFVLNVFKRILSEAGRDSIKLCACVFVWKSEFT